jgi:hypothetical protein
MNHDNQNYIKILQNTIFPNHLTIDIIFIVELLSTICSDKFAVNLGKRERTQEYSIFFKHVKSIVMVTEKYTKGVIRSQ